MGSEPRRPRLCKASFNVGCTRLYQFLPDVVAPSSVLARRVVLWPSARHLGGPNLPAVDAADLVLGAWRTQVARLTLSPAERAVWSNCHPSMVCVATDADEPKQANLVCRNWLTCPWCAGRVAGDIGRSLGLDDANYFKTNIVDKSLTCIWYEAEITDAGSGATEFLRRALRHKLTACTQLRLANQRTLRGFLWKIALAPALASSGHAVWRLCVRAAGLHEPAEGIVDLPQHWKAHTAKNVGREQVEKIAAFVAGYFPRVLTAPPTTVDQLATARRGMKLVSFAGIFRKNKKSITEDE